MTHEQIMRRMLQGFIQDPPDSEYQEGFLEAVRVIALEVIGIEWDDPLFQMLDGEKNTERQNAVASKAHRLFTVIDGGKPSPV